LTIQLTWRSLFETIRNFQPSSLLSERNCLETINSPRILQRRTLNHEILRTMRGSLFSIILLGETPMEQCLHIMSTERSLKAPPKPKFFPYSGFGNSQPALQDSTPQRSICAQKAASLIRALINLLMPVHMFRPVVFYVVHPVSNLVLKRQRDPLHKLLSSR